MKTFKSIIENEAQQPYYKAFHEFVEAEYASKTIFPPHNHILHAFNFCDYEDIKGNCQPLYLYHSWYTNACTNIDYIFWLGTDVKTYRI